MVTKPALRKKGLGRAGFAGAGGADHGNNRVIRRELGAGSLARACIATAVLAVELDVVIQDLAAGIINGDLDAVAWSQRRGSRSVLRQPTE